MSLKRYHSFHNSSPTDIYKPNFIFSLDIVDRVHQLCRLFRQFPGPDLALFQDILFTINVELNTLLNRNNNLRPSDLIKDNLVFLAKSSEGSLINRILINDDKLPINPKTFINNEVFIVTLTLKVLNFIVTPEFSIDFLKDENYGILVLCDYNFILRIEQYIAKLFNNSVMLNLDQEPHEINLSQDISGTETTLEISEHELSDYSDDNDDDTLIHERIKQPIPEEDFIGDMNNLRHNDGEMNGGFIRLDEAIEEQLQLAMKMNNIEPLSSSDDKENTVPKDIHRILPNSPLQSPVQQLKLEQPPQTLPQPFDQNVFDVQETNKPEFAINLKHSSPNLHHNPTTPDFPIPTKKPSRTFIPPPKPKKLASSISIDLHEFDNLDPDAAYIKGVKGDKKFKFIKVGKVQKFVNLFEEKVHQETDSVSTTRSGTRPTSNAGTRPSSRAGTRSTSTIGTRPSSQAGTRPTSQASTRPSSRASNLPSLDTNV